MTLVEHNGSNLNATEGAKYDLNHSKATLHIPNSLSRHVSRMFN